MALQLATPVNLINKFSNLEISNYEVEEKSAMPSKQQYKIKPISEVDSEYVLTHLRKFFFKDEPLNIAINLIENENSRCFELEDYSLKCIKSGLSLMAVTPREEIIGVCLNGTLCENDESEDDEECLNAKMAKIFKLLDYSGEEGTKAVLKKYPEVKKSILVKILSTDSAWRGQGVARKLLDRTRDIGREQGYSLMRVDCTSYFSARAIAKLGFECVYELNYDDYKENGKPVFTTQYPHKSFTVYIQKIR
ncbi:hypothetical protein RN001_002980 [Aquatica leii]|uniref:aralkylamine N-acetyltransferase n=1 Tax=Aquatica leii TaxID=1421715 RepID=A0AAN7SM31_9COLE|nr:hypothetical protein RN001_002980 [Aquatica leii]